MATTATIDDLTAAAIRQALASASAGRLADACVIGERALSQGGDAAALNAMLGMLRGRLGEPGRAADHLRVALEKRPDDVVIATNLVNTLVQLGEKEAALRVISDDLASSDKSLQLLRIRGFLAQELDDFPTAVPAYEEVVRQAPQDWESWNNLGNARRGVGDFEGSVEALRRAAELNPQSPPVRLNYATALGAAGHFEASEQQFRKMAEEFPDDPNPLRELYALLKEQRREDEALTAIEEAHQRDPSDLQILLGLAAYRLQLMRTAGAETAYREVINREPTNALGNLGLAVLLELTNRTDELAQLVDEARQRGVGDDVLSFIRAYDLRRKKRYAEGLKELDKVSEQLDTARRMHLLGQLHEGAGNFDEAFAAFSRMNEIQGEDASNPVAIAAAYRNMVRERHAVLTPEWVGSWREETVRDKRPSPAFLLGFPRSGTTLLDTMLMGHPKIEVLEEEPATGRAAEQLRDYAQHATATDEQIKAARDAYFRTAASLTPLAPGNLLVDKNPLAINAISLIHRVFPNAPIILALRHPCDVVLSCFKSNFRINDGMASFLQLDTAAELYDLSFRYFEDLQKLMPLRIHQIRYEDVVNDAESELRRLLEFLSVEWSEEVLDHQSTALGRGRIKTASYAQVAEPLYTRSAGRWQNYRKHLEPIIPVLRPWAEKFGYEI